MNEAIAIAAADSPHAMGRSAASAPKELLTFRMGTLEFGIDARKVREIRGHAVPVGIDESAERFPRAIHLGSTTVPIADLRRWFGLERAAAGMFTVTIILNLDDRALGVNVDCVSDVIRPAPGQIRPVPEFPIGPRAQYLFGVVADSDRRLILLDIEKLMLGVDSTPLEASLH